MQQQVNAKITDSYNAKGVSLETLKKFHNGDGQSIAVQRGAYLSKYTIVFQVLFPIIVIVFLGSLSHHLVENDNTGFFRKIRDAIDHPGIVVNENHTADIHSIKKVKVSAQNMHILILVVCSVTFVVYVLGLDIAAVHNRHVEVTEPIYYNPYAPGFNSTLYDNVEALFQLEYSIPIIMLLYDLLIFCVMVIGLIHIRCGLKKKLYHVGIAPVACIVVHSYHILVGFLHSPYHASGILIFYSIVFFVYFVTMRAAYYNLYQLMSKPKACCAWLKNCFDSLCCECKRDQPTKEKLYQTVCCWIFCLAGEAEREGLGCCKFDETYCSLYKFPHLLVLTVLCLLSILISVVLVFVVIIFILVPINMAIENAPNRLFGISQTILVFIGAAITYNLYRSQKTKTLFDHIVEANKSYLNDTTTGNEVTKWNNKEKLDKEIEMGKLIINTLHSQAIQNPAQANQAQLRAIQAQLQASQAQAKSVLDDSAQTICFQLQAIRAQLQAIRFQANPAQPLQTRFTAIQTQVEVIQTQANPVEAFKAQSQAIQTQLQVFQSLHNPAQTQLQAIKAQLRASQAQADSTQDNLVQTKVAQFQAISSQLQAVQDQVMSALAQANPAIQAQLQISQSQLQVIQDQLQSQPNPAQTIQADPGRPNQAQLEDIQALLQDIQTQTIPALFQAIQAQMNPTQAELQAIRNQLQTLQDTVTCRPNLAQSRDNPTQAIQ